MADERIVTESSLITDLRAIGVGAGQSIMLHASVSAIGWIVGGPDVLIHALQECIGVNGTLMMFAGWEERPGHFPRWSPERQAAYLSACPAFDPKQSRANRKWSILTE